MWIFSLPKNFSNISQKNSELKPTEIIFQEKLDELELEIYHFPLTIRERRELADEKDYDKEIKRLER